MRAPALSLVLPARNEAALIEDTVLEVTRFLEGIEPSYELIVGDSGSDDGTGDVVRAMGLSRVRVIRDPLPGKGRILTRCLHQARGHVVGFMDADLEIPVETVGRLLERMRAGAHVAVAAKTADLDTRPFRRRAATVTINWAIRTLFGSRLEDHQAGCKLFRADILAPLLPHLRSTGWLWDTEVLVGLRGRPLRIDSVGFEPRPARPSHMSMRAMTRTLWDLAHLRIVTPFAARVGPHTAVGAVEVPSAHA